MNKAEFTEFLENYPETKIERSEVLDLLKDNSDLWALVFKTICSRKKSVPGFVFLDYLLGKLDMDPISIIERFDDESLEIFNRIQNQENGKHDG